MLPLTEASPRRIFLSYARKQVSQVSEVAAKLRAAGHTVFFDQQSLRGEKYDQEIRAQVEGCDLFVFFVSTDSTRQGSYALTELGYAEVRWPDPSAGVVAIRADEVALDAVPAYLRAVVTVRSIVGNFATGAFDLIANEFAQSVRAPRSSGVRLRQLPVSEQAEFLVEALSRKRRLPPAGTATSEVVAEIDACVMAIRSQFRPDEGATVAGARLVKVIGVGNFGTVWEGVELETGRAVAVKIFRLERLSEGQMLFRFRKSIRAMRILGEAKRLEKSREAIGSIVQFIQQDASGLAFSMELVPGGNLDDISKHGWSLNRKLQVVSRICVAAAYSHANGVIHRDIKPANIVLDSEGAPVLTDFDIADVKFATSMSTTVEGGLGTPVFAAPEQLEDAELANERSDIYSIGRLLHYLLIERSPGYAVEKDPGLANLKGFPPAVVELVRRACQHDPARRFASVEHMLSELAACQTGSAAWRARVMQGRRWARHNWALLAVAGVLVAASSVVAVVQTKAAEQQKADRAELQELSALQSRLVDTRRVLEKAVEVERAKVEEFVGLGQLSSEQQDHLRLAQERLLQAKADLAKVDKDQQDLEQRVQRALNRSAPPGGSERSQLAPPPGPSAPVPKSVAPARTAEDECRNHLACYLEGRCTSQAGQCVAASTDDCRTSRQCEEHAKCVAMGGVCVAPSSDDCRKSRGCQTEGTCTAMKGDCIASLSADCSNSTQCRVDARCTAKDGKCVATSDDDCIKATYCATAGRCKFKDGICAVTEAYCENSQECAQYGRCAAQGVKCGPASEADCQQSSNCRAEGACGLMNGQCLALSDTDCRKATRCRVYGDCTASGFGQCWATSDEDCRQSKRCTEENFCTASRGSCVQRAGGD